jgi:hypothetical protein
MNFHADFAEALFAPPHGLFNQAAFAVYRNTVMKGCIDALEANFPAVARLVGSEWFRSAAGEYARAYAPRDARLLVYGDEGFGDFLQALPSAAGLPYLASIARLDTLWRAAHVAADAVGLAADALARDEPDALAARVLVPHPAARWAWFEDAPVASIWMRAREAETHEEKLAWRGEGLLITRPTLAVQWEPLSCGGCALLDACAQGLPLGDAAEQALAIDPETDLAAVLAQLLQAGAFTEGEPT